MSEHRETHRKQNRSAYAKERERLHKQRIAARERAAGIRRCRHGHRLPEVGNCMACAAKRSRMGPTEAELVLQILALDDERELAPSSEWPEYRRRIAELTAQIDALDRRKHHAARARVAEALL